MNSVGLFYLVLVAALYLFFYRRSPERTRLSLAASGQALLKMAPLLLGVFGLIGLFEVFVPPELIKQWMGEGTGFAALLVGGLVGAVAIGPPVAAFPIAGSFLQAGAWPPAVAAFIVSWVSVGVISLPVEAHVFGWRFALSRNAITFVAALLIGLIVGTLA
jgi:uncharacterized membrane protein YraQ (UPF0718 family)